MTDHTRAYNASDRPEFLPAAEGPHREWGNPAGGPVPQSPPERPAYGREPSSGSNEFFGAFGSPSGDTDPQFARPGSTPPPPSNAYGMGAGWAPPPNAPPAEPPPGGRRGPR